MNFIKDYQFRRWLYGVLAALFVVLAGYGIITAEEQENYLALVAAIINVSGSAGFGLAAVKAKPADSDETVPQPSHDDDSLNIF